MRKKIRAALFAGAIITITGTAAAAQPLPGEALYENHCTTCHASTVHIRERRQAQNLDAIRSWVIRWASVEELDWTREEVDSVTEYLNQRYYGF